MSLQHVSIYFPSPLEKACIAIGIKHIDVPIDGKPHKTILLGDESGQRLGYIKRALGGVCGEVCNIKTGQSRLFISFPEVVL